MGFGKNFLVWMEKEGPIMDPWDIPDIAYDKFMTNSVECLGNIAVWHPIKNGEVEVSRSIG